MSRFTIDADNNIMAHGELPAAAGSPRQAAVVVCQSLYLLGMLNYPVGVRIHAGLQKALRNSEREKDLKPFFEGPTKGAHGSGFQIYAPL